MSVDGRLIELTPTEYKLLLMLAERRGRVQGRAHLLETVWEAAPDIQTRTVDMHVQRLRTKLGDAGDLDRDRARIRLPSQERAVASARDARQAAARRLARCWSFVLVARHRRDRGQSSSRHVFAQETRRELEREARLVAAQWRPGINADSLADAAGAALVAARHADRLDRRRRRRLGVRRRAISQQLQNHSTRPEVIDARRHGIGWSMRAERIGRRRRDLRRRATSARLRARVGRDDEVPRDRERRADATCSSPA